jgi:hypothetical protein
VCVPVQVKAWVAASAMQAAPAQLKPQQQTQQLLGLAMPMALPHPQVRFSDTQQLTDEAKEATEANEVKEVAEDTVKTVAENAEHEAELEASVQEQGKMLKKLMGMVEKQHSAKKPTKAKAAAARPSAESQHEAELEATVEEQGKMIKKLMGMVNKPGKAAAKQGKAAPKTEAAPAKRQRSSAMPTLGSWDMAKAAGNDFGTNVVHLYSDLTTKGGGVQVKNPYSSGVSEAEVATVDVSRMQERDKRGQSARQSERRALAVRSLDAVVQVYRGKGRRSWRLSCSAACWGQQERLASYGNVRRESAAL